ncbi:MAG: HIT domain-containing protein [Nitrospirae bacterium]|nr:HIT domain-containing protein [Nitrospirota bacterium]
MKRLWAPWRMEYILSEDKNKSCLFCDVLAAGKASDKKNLILYRGKQCFVIMNRYPYNSGHLMVVPNHHTSSFDGLSDKVLFDLIKTIDKSVSILRKCLRPDGFNIGLNFGKVAGAGMEQHMHIHIVPRWAGDTDSMPIISETRVMPEHLKKTYSKLRAFFRKNSDLPAGSK